MLFEEFFKKKKINLVALNEADAELFSEFKDHYEQMGEKSFDHTKKYWFNKLRRQYPLPIEPKVEKFKAENQLAEQTVADTLTEPTPRDKAPDLSNIEPPVNEQATPAAPAPKLGFKPKFKSAGSTQSLANETPVVPTEDTDNTAKEPTVSTLPKPGFKPRFKAGVTAAAKPNEESTETPKTDAIPAEGTETPVNETPSVTPSKIGFKPRFKTGVTPTIKPAEESSEALIPNVTPAEPADKPTNKAPAPAKMGFTPSLKAGVTNTKPAEQLKIPKQEEIKPDAPEERTEAQAEQPAPANLGFKPRFKAGVTTTKPAEEPIQSQQDEAAKEEISVPVEPQASISPAEQEQPAAKPAYKPRFTPNMIKPKPSEEE
jgi:hypothetical protein